MPSSISRTPSSIFLVSIAVNDPFLRDDHAYAPVVRFTRYMPDQLVFETESWPSERSALQAVCRNILCHILSGAGHIKGNAGNNRIINLVRI